jgi:hypothetical protein
MMNADVYLMTSRLPAVAASKDRAVHELTTALAAMKAAGRVGDDAESERGQWGVIDAASNLCQVTGGNIVELGNLMTAGLTSYNTASANMATVIDTDKELAHALDDPPPPPDISEGTAD